LSGSGRRQPEIEILEIVGLEDAEQKPGREPDLPRKALLDSGRADGIRTVLREMLPALDDLERCVRMLPDAATLDEGVRLALRHLWNTFRQHELERIEGDGVPFDPEIHEAAVVTKTDRVTAGTVLEVMRVGYMLGGELVRPALVRVAVSDSSGTEEGEEE